VRSISLVHWNTVAGGSGGTYSAVQGEADYADLDGVQDFAAYLEVSNYAPASTGSTYIDLQCSPTKDNVWFDSASMGASSMFALRFALGSGFTAGVQPVQVCRLAGVTNTQLPARYLRWKVTLPNGAGTSTTVTFRILINALQVG
jgi:hypothetical protein